MLLLLIIGVIEGILRTYDYINPRCDFVNNDASKELDYHIKKQICENWETGIFYVDPVTGMLALEPNQHNSIMNINKHGFRGTEISKEKPDNIYRIFIVGGSTTLSLRALSDQHTIPGYLQEDFNQLDYNKKIEVINAGMAAYTSAGELQLIKTKIIDFHPDMIIIYDGANDVHGNPYRILEEKYYDITSLQEIYLRYFTFYKTPKVTGGLISEVISKKDPLIIKPRTYDVTRSQIKADDWMNNIQQICDLGENNDFKTIIVLQPILGTGNKIFTEHEKKLYEFWDMKNIIPPYQLFADNLGKLKGTCTSTMDLRNIFDDVSESVYFDKAHINYKYNEVVAKKIFELVLPTV